VLNQIEVRFSSFISQIASPNSPKALDARLRLLERQDRSAAEELSARSVETQLFTDPALLSRANELLATLPSRLARHICASLLAATMVVGLGNPALANDSSGANSSDSVSVQGEQTGLPSLLDIIEEIVDDTVELLTSDNEEDPDEGTR
jgi:hypothetical protein